MPPLGAHGQIYLGKEDDVRHQEDRRLKCRPELPHVKIGAHYSPLHTSQSHVTAQMVTDLSTAETWAR